MAKFKKQKTTVGLVNKSELANKAKDSIASTAGTLKLKGKKLKKKKDKSKEKFEQKMKKKKKKVIEEKDESDGDEFTLGKKKG